MDMIGAYLINKKNSHHAACILADNLFVIGGWTGELKIEIIYAIYFCTYLLKFISCSTYLLFRRS